MKEFRSASQILFGFLPQQTVDLRKGIWKVKDWRFPKVRSDIDGASLRRELLRQATPWQITKMDSGFVDRLHAKEEVRVLVLDESNGVEVEQFPKLWRCNKCFRVHDEQGKPCPCGAKGDKGQLHFVGYHDQCGAIRTPYIRKCKEHRQVRVNFPGTSSSSEIVFDCPVCNQVLQKGFGTVACDCGLGQGKEKFLKFNVHRASSVYTPRSVVIVNPPSKEKIQAITTAGGRPRALSWVVSGMKTHTVEEVPTSKESLRRQLLSQGLPPEIVEKMLQVADEGAPDFEDDLNLPENMQEEAESEAVTIALATLDSRISLERLIEASADGGKLEELYRLQYPAALKTAGLCGVDLIEKFPVLTGHFGFTRGDFQPGASKLVPFKGKHGKGFQIYGDVAETEALFVRLDPVRVASWLVGRGFSLPEWSDEKSARIAILSAAHIPSAFDEPENTVGAALLELVHSYAHRFLRTAAVHAGIERHALSELLVPLHLGFFVYAAAKGDFVLGGLQSVFESELNRLLRAVVFDEHRCALDPGCNDMGGACMACLHVGEPSCRYFNRFLTRAALFGTNGYLRR